MGGSEGKRGEEKGVKGQAWNEAEVKRLSEVEGKWLDRDRRQMGRVQSKNCWKSSKGLTVMQLLGVWLTFYIVESPRSLGSSFF